MSVEERVRYLLRAATRAETEGDEFVARIFRRMAEEAVPLQPETLARVLGSKTPCGQE